MLRWEHVRSTNHLPYLWIYDSITPTFNTHSHNLIALQIESLELLTCRPRKQRGKDYIIKYCVAWRAMKQFFHELFDFGLGMCGPALLMFADGVSSDFINGSLMSLYLWYMHSKTHYTILFLNQAISNSSV